MNYVAIDHPRQYSRVTAMDPRWALIITPAPVFSRALEQKKGRMRMERRMLGCVLPRKSDKMIRGRPFKGSSRKERT
jgi:hypothetical protein